MPGLVTKALSVWQADSEHNSLSERLEPRAASRSRHRAKTTDTTTAAMHGGTEGRLLGASLTPRNALKDGPATRSEEHVRHNNRLFECDAYGVPPQNCRQNIGRGICDMLFIPDGPNEMLPTLL